MNEPNKPAKRAWHLLPLEIVALVVDVFQEGAKKPGRTEDGWQTVPNGRQEYEDALMRHWERYRSGETADPDDGKHPLAHLLADGIILLWYAVHGVNP